MIDKLRHDYSVDKLDHGQSIERCHKLRLGELSRRGGQLVDKVHPGQSVNIVDILTSSNESAECAESPSFSTESICRRSGLLNLSTDSTFGSWLLSAPYSDMSIH